MINDNWNSKLEAERLRLSSPETVYAWLAGLPPASENRFSGNCADVIVKTLLERDDPLINLALARFTANHQLLKLLWDKGGLVRTALLANRAYGPLFPTSDFFSAGDPDLLRPIIEEMSVDDLDALYSNPRIPAALLDQTFRNTIGLSEDGHRLACRLAVRNERLKKTLDRPHTFDEMTTSREHAKPIHAFWDMVRTAPATEPWSSVLADAGTVAFELGLPKEFTPDLGTKEGWVADWLNTLRQRDEAYRKVFMHAAQTRWLGPEEERNDPCRTWIWARAAISEAVCRTRPRNPEFTWEHPDLGFRIGCYRAAAVSSQWDVEAMAEKDGESFMDAVVWNESLYERGNYGIQRRIRHLARTDALTDRFGDSVYVEWMSGRLESLVAKDPLRYGDEPTEEMAEELRRQEEREAAALEARRLGEKLSAALAPVRPSSPAVARAGVGSLP